MPRSSSCQLQPKVVMASKALRSQLRVTHVIDKPKWFVASKVITTKKCYFIDLIIMVLSTFE